MCTSKKELKFCTCLTDNNMDPLIIQKDLFKFQKKQIPGAKEPYSWVLFEHKGSEEHEGMVGLMNLPSDKIGADLTEEYVIGELNGSRPSFDFDYSPKEGDNLQINFQRNASWTEFLSFIFKNDKWIADSYFTFTEIIEIKDFGIMKVESKGS